MGDADPGQRVSVTIVLRRNADAQGAPGLADFTPLGFTLAEPSSVDAFTARFGADRDDIEAVVDFLRSRGLTVAEIDPAARTIAASGTVASLSDAFGVRFGRYEVPAVSPMEHETYRGRDGYVHVPDELADTIIGVFGLDSRAISKRVAAGPAVGLLGVSEVGSHYRFPQHSAAGQTIAILSEDGYRAADVHDYFATLADDRDPPKIIDVSVGASNTGNADQETTQDICIAATVARDADVAVYFTSYDQKGWFDAISRVIHPRAGDPTCSVLSISFYVANGDGSAQLAAEGISVAWLTAVTAVFQDAALRGITVCVASGDGGSDSRVGDRKAHVQYPASDPWVLSCGGTELVRSNEGAFDEQIWNDGYAATGGGISDFFDVPPYQQNAGLPRSVNDPTRAGRGVPDVAANASAASGYAMRADGTQFVGYGTSAAAPLYAGLIAILNAALGARVGFLNPVLYQASGAPCRSVQGPPGPADNGVALAPGYPARGVWNACSGWGVIDGEALLAHLRGMVTPQQP